VYESKQQLYELKRLNSFKLHSTTFLLFVQHRAGNKNCWRSSIKGLWKKKTKELAQADVQKIPR
jgi:hypothetical protein